MLRFETTAAGFLPQHCMSFILYHVSADLNANYVLELRLLIAPAYIDWPREAFLVLANPSHVPPIAEETSG